MRGRTPVPPARLIGSLALAGLAATEWARLVDGLGPLGGLAWVAVAALVGAAVWACGSLPPPLGRRAIWVVAATGLLAAVPVSGLDPGLLRPGRWAELLDGLSAGTAGLMEARLPYAGPDAWPRLTLQLAGASLSVLAALLVCWPRASSRGFPFLAVCVLLALAAAPVVSLGGARSVLFSAALAGLTVCCLWLERLPLRPGVGVVALVSLAFVGALPLAGAADREEPWFDYKAAAAGAGATRPVSFDWRHAYGPLDWPRGRREVLRVRARDAGGPEYWKATTLNEFDGEAWVPGTSVDVRIPDAVATRPEWTRRFDVSVRRLRSSEVIGPGAVLGVSDASRPVRPTSVAGRWEAVPALRSGDSYAVKSFTPRPTREELASATSGAEGRQADALTMLVAPRRRPGAAGRAAPRPLAAPSPATAVGTRTGTASGTAPGMESGTAPGMESGTAGDPAISTAAVRFSAFGSDDPPRSQGLYPTDAEINGGETLRRSAYARTWDLARRLRRRARTPYEYVSLVDRHLDGPAFSYAERPPQPVTGVAPLDAFLFETRAGYCQHYSGAMALLLRMGGVPARVATGFSPGGYSGRRKAWVVRDTDAHSWVEAWFDAYGWVTFDPTPPATPARSLVAALSAAGDDSGAGSAPGQGEAGSDRVGREQTAVGDGADGSASSGEDEGAGPADSGRDAGTWRWLAGLAAVFAAAGSVVVLARHRRRRPARPSEPLDRAIAELQDAVRRVGRPEPAGMTLRQLEQRFEPSPDAAAYVRALRSARYGIRAPERDAGRRRAVRRELARGEGWPGRLRALRALPPGRRGGW